MSLGELDRLLSPKQLRSIAEATARLNLWEGAVRSGKTIASLWAWLLYVAFAPTGGELVMVGRTADTVFRNLLQPLMNADLFGSFARQVQYTPGARTARIFGRLVHIIGANDVQAEAKIRGMTVAGAYVDEVTILPQVFWDQLVARISVPGAMLFGSTNPDSPAHWLKRDWLDSGNPSVRSWHFTLDDNNTLDPEYVAHLKRSYVGLWYRRFILGQWVIAEGAVYDMWDETEHVVDAVPNIVSWLGTGIDYGTTNPFHAVLVGRGDDDRLYATAEFRYDSRQQRRQLTDVEYSQRYRQWLRNAPIPNTQLTGVSPAYHVLDPSAASFRVQLNQDGVTAHLADNSVLDGIRTVSGLLGRRKLLIHRSCAELIKELPGYSWDAKASLLGEDKPMKVDDHGCDALRYLAQTTQSVWRGFIDQPASSAYNLEHQF